MTKISPLVPNSASSILSADKFIERWVGVEASELSTAQSFVRELCEVLGVAVPHPTADKDYMFERPVTFKHGDGSESSGRIDCYRRGAFVLEAKKLSKAPGKGFNDAMLRARAQAESYARALPAIEGRPPFLLIIDVGNIIEIYAEFSRSGATYIPFPDSASHRVTLGDLAKPEIQARLKAIWLDPLSLDPTRTNAKVTRLIATHLAEVAKTLEAAGHSSQEVAGFLTRCLFTMFAEDVGLLPRTHDGQGVLADLLKRFRDDPATLSHMLRALWQDMDRGGFSAVLTKEVLRFNGKLFKQPAVLPLNKEQIDLLLEAAKANWKEVEPAIFGTLLERALNPIERHALGAHYTPRAYVERLVLPTIIEPLRADWNNVQTAALLLANEADGFHGKKRDAKMEAARDEVRRFHHALTQVRVLDPACGSGNFLYVTLEHMKRLEGEVLDLLAALGDNQQRFDAEGLTVDPHQFLGIELNPRAAAIAELVLWIGYLQWHFRTRGNAQPPQPVLKDFANIECRDAALVYEGTQPAIDANGLHITRWDGVAFKTHPVTGEQVPNEASRTAQLNYVNPRKAQWPQADFIIGNPPFIGAASMRAALGDGYVDALRNTWIDVPSSADFVMYWWQHAAEQVRTGKTRRFGLITTNSLRQTFNRRVVEQHLTAGQPLSLVFAIPDHPWVDSGDGAAVRISMTVAACGAWEGQLLTVKNEAYIPGDDAAQIVLGEQLGKIHADLTIGANVSAAKPLMSNQNISSRGVMLFGAGFIVTPAEANKLGLGQINGLERHIREYRNGRDLTDAPRGVLVIDFFGLTAEETRTRYPAAYQWLTERVKPERDANRDKAIRDNWWLHGRTRSEFRPALAGLPRYIATVETAKHRIFQFLDSTVLPDNKLVAIALSNSLHLGILSSKVHIEWAKNAGSWLGVGNDSVYVKTRCFETFPFPSEDTGLTLELWSRIADLAEQIDVHRKCQQAQFPKLTLTGMYNVLEKLRRNEPLTTKEKTIHEQGLVTVLRTFHDELDAAVLAAYGWSDLASNNTELNVEALLQRLVELNSARVGEETKGTVRWLRPEYQNAGANNAVTAPSQEQENIEFEEHTPAKSHARSAQKSGAQWPKTLPEQVSAVSGALAAAPHGLPLDILLKQFKGKGQWKKDMLPILETLAALGRAKNTGDTWHLI